MPVGQTETPGPETNSWASGLGGRYKIVTDRISPMELSGKFHGTSNVSATFKQTMAIDVRDWAGFRP
jgi:hypothetical protein